MTAYYNEIDPYAAQWLRNLIAAGHIADGYVDERSISDVRPADLAGFTQCHFFAGIGVWSHALRLGGWRDDRPIWTGSCPCQPFSAAGKGAGFDDERHLWPHWEWLIRECRPPVMAGEQVASKDTGPWIDLIHADLEALGYAFGCVPFPAAGVGAPHIRDRNYWMADLPVSRWGRRAGWHGEPDRRAAEEPRRLCDAVRLDHHHQGSQGYAGHGDGSGGRSHALGSVAEAGVSERLADQPLRGQRILGCQVESGQVRHTDGGSDTPCRLADDDDDGFGSTTEPRLRDAPHHAEPCGGDERRTSPTNGLWADADWLLCRDGKWRPVEPGTFPLAHGAASRVGRLRAYGNAIVAEAAVAFIASYLEHERDAAAPNCNPMLIGHNGGPLMDFQDLLG